VADNTPTRRYGLLGHALGFNRYPPHAEMRQSGRLYEAFRCGLSFLRGRLIELALPWLRRKYFPHVFAPDSVTIEDEAFEAFDPELFDQKPGTWLAGLFQSPAYFGHNEKNVRQRFSATRESAARLDYVLRQWPAA
jgi:hypothetical protein